MDEYRGDGLAEGWQFERFIHELVSRMYDVPLADLDGGRDAGLGADIRVQHGDRPVFVEIKSATPQTARRLHGAAEQLRTLAVRYQRDNPRSPAPRLVLAFPGVLAPRKEIPHGIEIWDGRHLQREARRLGIAAPPFLAAAEGEERAEEREPADELTGRLGFISPGQSGWSQYEKFCEDLLSFLFCPPLRQVISQSRTETGVNRRDFILPNYAPDGFWGFMRVHYHADFIVAEAKNLSGPARKAEVLQLANYLTRHGTGLVGMLLTRKGFSADARWTSREQWLLHDKLIVGLDDEDYKQMLATKRVGGNPADLIRQRIEDFRLRI